MKITDQVHENITEVVDCFKEEITVIDADGYEMQMTVIHLESIEKMIKDIVEDIKPFLKKKL